MSTVTSVVFRTHYYKEGEDMSGEERIQFDDIYLQIVSNTERILIYAVVA